MTESNNLNENHSLNSKLSWESVSFFVVLHLIRVANPFFFMIWHQYAYLFLWCCLYFQGWVCVRVCLYSCLYGRETIDFHQLISAGEQKENKRKMVGEIRASIISSTRCRYGIIKLNNNRDSDFEENKMLCTRVDQ